MTFLQAVLDGTAQGAIYALVALGFVIIYKATQVISFAQPAIMVCGGLFAYHFIQVWELPFWAGLGLAVLAGAALGVVVERLAIRPMLGKPVFTIAIITIGVDIILRVGAAGYIGATPKIVHYPNGWDRIDFFGLTITHQRVALLAVTVVAVVALALFFRFTKSGLAMRATAISQEVSLAQGMRVGVVFAMAWGLAGGLAAISGTFVAAGTVGIEQTTWIIALKALPAIIIGGLDSIPGAVIGGVVVGVVEALTAVYQPTVAPWLGSSFFLVAPYVVMFIVLLIRPYGLFGTKEITRV